MRLRADKSLVFYRPGFLVYKRRFAADMHFALGSFLKEEGKEEYIL